MPWFKELCNDLVCGGTVGIAKGVFGISLFTESEMDEIISLKKLAISVMKKAPKIVTEVDICKGIENGQQAALNDFTNGLSPEAIAAGVGVAAELVCNKSFKQRFADVLMSACTNLVGCG